MNNERLATLIIECSCEDKFRSTVTLKRHVEETGHSLKRGETVRINGHLQALGSALEAARLQVAFIQRDIEDLGSVIAMSQAEARLEMQRRVTPTPCIQCKKPTRDRFGGRPRCKNHIANGQADVAAVLEALLYE